MEQTNHNHHHSHKTKRKKRTDGSGPRSHSRSRKASKAVSQDFDSGDSGSDLERHRRDSVGSIGDRRSSIGYTDEEDGLSNSDVEMDACSDSESDTSFSHAHRRHRKRKGVTTAQIAPAVSDIRANRFFLGCLSPVIQIDPVTRESSFTVFGHSIRMFCDILTAEELWWFTR